jgi:hypothetical protein
MQTAINVHFVVAFLVALCALAFSWNTLGRRVMSGVLALQLLSGIALAGTFGASHAPLPGIVGWHILGALAALAFYGMAAGAGRRPNGARRALIFSLAGLVCVGITIAIGTHMYFNGS